MQKKSQKILSAFKWDLTGTITQNIVSFLASIFLARLLTPEEFGIVAMAMVFITLFNILSNFGLQHAIIQHQKTDALTLSSVFYLNTILGISFFAISILLAPIIADFYEFPILKHVFQLLSVTFIFQSLSIVQVALFSIRLDFKSLNIRLIISNICAAFIGIILAIKGYGVYAIVWQQILASFLNCALLWIRSEWRPILAFSWDAIQSLLRFSLYLFLGQLLFKVIKSLDELIIGKLFSASTLGYFGRSNSLVNTINNITTKSISNVLFSVLSNSGKNEETFKKIYLSSFSLIALGSFCLSGVAILSGEAIILGIFGPQWEPSVEIFQILMFKLFTHPTNNFLINALLAKGFSKENFIYGILRKALRISIFGIAFLYGFKAFLIADVILSYLIIIYNNIINSIYLKISFIEEITQIFVPFASFIVCLTIAITCCPETENMYLDSFLKSAVFACLYFIIIFIYRKDEMIRISNLLFNKAN